MGANVKALKSRIRSVDSTLHLTRAMGLVASSKMRRAGEAMTRSREYANAFSEAMALLAQAYRAKQLFPATRRMTVKRYPAALAAAMEAAGFRREMLDYVLER